MFRLYTCDKARLYVLITIWVMEQDFLTLEEVAQRLKKSTQTVRRMIKRGELPAQRVKTPQGFHYVVKREHVAEEQELTPSNPIPFREPEPNAPENPPIQMFSDSPIQNAAEPQYIEEKPVLINQNQILTNQTAIHPLKEDDFYTIDKKTYEFSKGELMKWLEREHKEKLLLIHILEKMQDQVRHNSRKALPFWKRWL